MRLLLMDRSPPDADVEWLHDEERPHPLTSEIVERSSRRWLPAAVLIVFVSAFAVPAILRADYSNPASESSANASEAERARASALGNVSVRLAPGTSDDVNAMHGQVVTELRGLAALGLAFRAVLTSPDSGYARLVSVTDNGDVRVAPLPESTDFGFDASGQWLAGVTELAESPGGELRRVLWAGRVGSSPKPLAIGIGSYAWHDSAPGLLAWTEEADQELTTLSLEGPESSLTTISPVVAGDVAGWGDWGFALMTTGFDFVTAVLDPSGTVVEPALSGRFGGQLSTGELLLTGGLDDPVAFDPTSGRAREVRWLGSGQYIRSSTPANDPTETILVVGREDASPAADHGEITLLNGEAPAVLAVTDAITDIVWSLKRQVVVFADQQRSDAGSSGRIRVVDRNGMVDAVLIPDLFRGQDWVAALSVL